MTIPIDRLVRSRRKTIALVVEKDASLTVRAPLQMHETAIRAFVEQHTDWITRNQQRAQRFSPPPPKKFIDGETFLYLGHAYPLEIVDKQRPSLTFDLSSFRLARSALPGAGEAFIRWYKGQAQAVIQERAPKMAALYHFSYTKVRISSARTRWGSCSSSGTLSFTWRLIMAPTAIIDYVILHELVHTRIRNHSRIFWAKVGELLPEYKQHVCWLKQNGKHLSL